MVLSVTCATFAVSDKVTPEVIFPELLSRHEFLTYVQTYVKLNSSCPEDLPAPQTYTNYFTPAMHDVSKMLPLSEGPVTFVVEVFDEDRPDDLHKLYNDTINKQMPANGLVGALACAVLDERSTQDDTVLIYYYELTYDDGTEEPNGRVYYHWRVRFSDAYDMVRTIENCNLGVVEEYVLKASKRYTNDDGVFEYARARDAVDAGDRGD